MVPKVVQDAGYTAVGLGVMAAQQVQTRRRKARAELSAKTRAAQAQLGTVLERVKTTAAPVADRLPRLPGPVGSVVESGRERVRQALR